jgi:poly(glycerol-phosphate) alpha-glucosyltransferase
VKTASVIASLSRKAGGVFESVRRLHQCLAEIPGMAVSVLGTQDEFTSVDLAAWSPVTVYHFGVLGTTDFGYAPALCRKLLELGSDIIHTHGIWQYPSVATLAWHKKCAGPYLVSPHGMLDPWALKNSAWKKRAARMLYEGSHLRRAACLRALCESEARSMRAYGLRNPICVIPNGIDLPRVVERPELAVAETSPLQRFAAGRKLLLYLGRIHPKKGLVNLLKAWRQVSGRWSVVGGQTPEWMLAIAGWDEGGHEAELKRLASELGLAFADVREDKAESRSPASDLCPPASVLFLGPQFGEEKAACYRGCEAFILPSFSEGLPMVVLEAWAYGKPVLMTAECNLPEGFGAGAALRIEPSAESIAQALEDVFRAPPSALRTMGEKGRELVRDRFTWPKVAAEMKAVYDWVLGSGPKPGCILPS